MPWLSGIGIKGFQMEFYVAKNLGLGLKKGGRETQKALVFEVSLPKKGIITRLDFV